MGEARKVYTKRSLPFLVCTKCRAEKPTAAFRVRTSNGRKHSWCSDCQKSHGRAYQRAKRAVLPNPQVQP